MRILLVLCCAVLALGAQDTAIQTGTGHAFACADYSQGKVCIVSKDGAVEWSHPAKNCKSAPSPAYRMSVKVSG